MRQEVPPFFQEKSFLIGKFPWVHPGWLTASLAVIAGVCILLFSSQSSPKALHFAQAENLFAKWEAAPQDDALYQQMAEAFRKVPSLQKKYGAIIAQKLIGGGKGAEALHMAYQALELARGEAPFHASFAETSLLIEQEEYQLALERTVALKEQMGREWDLNRFLSDRLVGGALLYGYNLLRIAFLQQELQNRPGEKAAWDEVERFLNSTTPVQQLLFSSFQENEVDLPQYISARRMTLQ